VEILEGAGQFAADSEASYVEQLRVPDLSLGTYSIPAGADDPQQPHTEDEVYVVVSGRGKLWTPTQTADVGPGTVAFVPAGEEHRFVDVVEPLTVLVVFGPAEYSRGAGE
jgi:mannose-6-phosphate isomerase-like protein (cupin superfamily)